MQVRWTAYKSNTSAPYLRHWLQSYNSILIRGTYRQFKDGAAVEYSKRRALNSLSIRESITEHEGIGCFVKDLLSEYGECRVRNRWKPLFWYTLEFEQWFSRHSKKNLSQNILVTADCFGWRWPRFHFTGAHISHKFKQEWNFMTNYSVNVGADYAFTWYFRRKKKPPSKDCIVIRPQID